MVDSYLIHHTALFCLIVYVCGSMGQGVLFCSAYSIYIEGYSVADWAGCPNTRRSIIG